MAIARPAGTKPAAATDPKTAAKPAATKPAAAPKPAPKTAPVEDEHPVETALDEPELHDHSMDVPDDDVPPAAPIATRPSTAVAQRSQQVQEDDDFDDLESEVGFGSYEIMKLDKHEYICGEHTFDGKTGVDVILRGGKKKYLFKARKGDEDGIPLAYSYDQKRATDGRPLEEIFAEWRAAGEMEGEPICSRYYECGAEVVMPGHPLDGEMVLLNVAPASVTRLAGYKQRLKIKGLKLFDVVTKLTLGKKIQPKGSAKTFFPWEFKLVGKVAA